MINTVFEPSMLFIHEDDWNDEVVRDDFLSHLEKHLMFISEYKVTKIYWNDELESYLWSYPQRPPWRLSRDWSNPLVLILYRLFSRNIILLPYFQVQNSCSITPDLNDAYNRNILVAFLKIVHELIHREQKFILCLGIKNKSFSDRDFLCTCNCFGTSLSPEIVYDPNDWLNISEIEKIFFNHLKKKNWKPKQILFPLVEISNQLVNSDWDTFIQSLAQNPAQRIARIKEIGNKVARLNGYCLNRRVSIHNSRIRNGLRAIYEAGSGRNKIFLSIDFEKGSFEVCSFKGEHLGEYGFNGSKIADADKTGNHNIHLP